LAEATRNWNANSDSNCNSDIDPIIDSHADCDSDGDRIIDGNTKSNPFSYV
jgi:hypothetical protein